MNPSVGVPQPDEAQPYFFRYIQRISSPDVITVLERQLDETIPLLRSISDEQSLHRYAEGKWSIREMWSHVNDAERVFVYRALWFARGFDSPLPSFDQEVGAKAAEANRIAWPRHIDEFQHIRRATLSLFRHLPADAWESRGTASGGEFTVRALAYVVAGHTDHHLTILKEKYLR
jgi:hypothetical protein